MKVMTIVGTRPEIIKLSSTIKELDGSVTTVEEHLYAKYLYLTRFDDINNYKTIADPR